MDSAVGDEAIEGTGAGDETSTVRPSFWVSEVKMQKQSIRGVAGPRTDSYVKGTQEDNGSGLKLLSGPKSTIFWHERRKLSLVINPYGSLHTTLMTICRTRLSLWKSREIVADPHTRMGRAPTGGEISCMQQTTAACT